MYFDYDTCKFRLGLRLLTGAVNINLNNILFIFGKIFLYISVAFKISNIMVLVFYCPHKKFRLNSAEILQIGILDVEHAGGNIFIVFSTSSAECLLLKSTFKRLSNGLTVAMRFILLSVRKLMLSECACRPNLAKTLCNKILYTLNANLYSCLLCFSSLTQL